MKTAQLSMKEHSSPPLSGKVLRKENSAGQSTRLKNAHAGGVAPMLGAWLFSSRVASYHKHLNSIPRTTI